MSPRDSFWFLAGALVSLAVMAVVRTWLRRHPIPAARPSIPSFAVPVAAGLALLGVALGIYFLMGSQDSSTAHGGAVQAAPAAALPSPAAPAPMASPAASAGSLDDVTHKLASRLAARGGSDGEWKLLAESYDYMGRTADAKAARAHIASGSVPGPAPQQSASPPGAEQIAAVADALDKH